MTITSEVFKIFTRGFLQTLHNSFQFENTIQSVTTTYIYIVKNGRTRYHTPTRYGNLWTENRTIALFQMTMTSELFNIFTRGFLQTLHNSFYFENTIQSVTTTYIYIVKNGKMYEWVVDSRHVSRSAAKPRFVQTDTSYELFFIDDSLYHFLNEVDTTSIL